MELAHGGGTLCVTSGNSVVFLDIARSVPVLVHSHPLDLSLPRAPSLTDLCVSGHPPTLLRHDPPLSVALPHPPTSVSLHPYLRDRFIAGSANDPWVRVYDLDTATERECYKGHHGPVHSVSYSPDGEMYASGSEDGTVSSLALLGTLCHRLPRLT